MKLSKAYEILGIPEGSEPDITKKAYRALALKTHPDKNQDDPNAKNKFQEVSAAYKRITDPKSAIHDADSDDEDEEVGFDMSEEEMFGMFDDMFSDLMEQYGPKLASGEMNEEDLMEHVMLGGMHKMFSEAMGMDADDGGNPMSKEDMMAMMMGGGIDMEEIM